MLWGSYTHKQQEELLALANSLADVEPDFLKNKDLLDTVTLTWFQCFCVEHCYISGGTLVSLGTGLGKTATSVAYTRRRLSENPGKKGIFFCLPESIEQIVDDFNDYCTMRTVFITGESQSIQGLSYTNIESWDVLIASYESLYSVDFCNWLVTNMRYIDCCTYDEVHELSQDSLINGSVSTLCRSIKNTMFLTATPITVSPVQVITLMNMLDPRMIPEGKSYLKPYEIRDKETFAVIDYKPLDDLSVEMFPRYVSWTREELGLLGNYHVHLLVVEPSEEQRGCRLIDIPTLLKGKRDSNQVQTFKGVIKTLANRHKIGLCYSDRVANSEMLRQELESIGVRAVVMNGVAENKKYRQLMLKLFKSGEIDIIITNLTMSLNIECDYLFYWENTNKAIQMLGRCQRGFLPKDLDIYYLLTEDTADIKQFHDNVYLRCKWLKEGLGKDIDVFERLMNGVRHLQ